MARAKRGGRLTIKAKTMNELVRSQRQSRLGNQYPNLTPTEGGGRSHTTVVAENKTLVDLEVGDVAQIDWEESLPEVHLPSRREIPYKAYLPSRGIHQLLDPLGQGTLDVANEYWYGQNIGVALEPIKAGKYGRLAIDGIARVKLDITPIGIDDGDRHPRHGIFAKPEVDSTRLVADVEEGFSVLGWGYDGTDYWATIKLTSTRPFPYVLQGTIAGTEDGQYRVGISEHQRHFLPSGESEVLANSISNELYHLYVNASFAPRVLVGRRLGYGLSRRSWIILHFDRPYREYWNTEPPGGGDPEWERPTDGDDLPLYPPIGSDGYSTWEDGGSTYIAIPQGGENSAGRWAGDHRDVEVEPLPESGEDDLTGTTGWQMPAVIDNADLGWIDTENLKVRGGIAKAVFEIVPPP